MISAFVEKCHQNGTRLVNRAQVADLPLIRSLSGLLFGKGRDGCHDQFLIATQWQALGRPGELGLLNVSDFYWSTNVNTLMGDWSRMKANQESVHQLAFFASNLEWEVDIFHCIGTKNACYPDSGGKAYPLLSDGGVAAYLNRVLKKLMEGDEYDYTLTGYGIRRGGATAAAQNEYLTIYQIIQRGGWTIDAVSSVFEYIAGTSFSDQKVGRVLAGWDNPKTGIPPSFLFAQDIEQQLHLLWQFCSYLFRYACKDWRKEILECACASILMYLPDTKREYRDHPLHTAVTDAAAAVGASEELIAEWSTSIRRRFIIENLPALPMKVIEGMDPQLAATITARQDTFMEFLENQSKLIFVLHQNFLKIEQDMNLMKLDNKDIKSMLMAALPNTAQPTTELDTNGGQTHHECITHGLPIQLQDLKGVPLRTVFMLWYMEKLHLVKMTADYKKILEPVVRVVKAMKRFLAPHTVIPNWEHAGSPSFSTYKGNIETLALEAEHRLIEWCMDWRAYSKQRQREAAIGTGKPLKTARSSKKALSAAVQGRVKDIRAASKVGYALPPQPPIIEQFPDDAGIEMEEEVDSDTTEE